MELTVVTKLGPDSKENQADALVHKHLEYKLTKIEQRWGKPLAARVVLEELPVGFDCTVSVHGSTEIVGKAFGEQLLKAADLAMDKITRQFEDMSEMRTGRERQRRGSGTIKITN